MKNLDFYTYETPKVWIKWNGMIQPINPFKSATEAKNHIKKTFSWLGSLEKFSIQAIDLANNKIIELKPFEKFKNSKIKNIKNGEIKKH